MRMHDHRALVGAALLGFLLSGCPQGPPRVPSGDGGDPYDFRDTDGDGLCNSTEISWGTDPNTADTDGDGLPDRVEVELGYEPTRTDSPGSDLLVRVAEVAGMTRVPIAHVVRGDGESFAGSFQTLPVSDPEGLDASSFYAGSLAFGAEPRDNVFQIVPEDELFAGVIGQTQLVFEAFFEVRPNPPPRGCSRAYPWRYNIKREDGTLLLARRYVLIVEAQGADFCRPAGVCL